MALLSMCTHKWDFKYVLMRWAIMLISFNQWLHLSSRDNGIKRISCKHSRSRRHSRRIIIKKTTNLSKHSMLHSFWYLKGYDTVWFPACANGWVMMEMYPIASLYVPLFHLCFLCRLSVHQVWLSKERGHKDAPSRLLRRQQKAKAHPQNV